MPYVQFKHFVRRDKEMQRIIIKDSLKILIDKLYYLKNLI